MGKLWKSLKLYVETVGNLWGKVGTNDKNSYSFVGGGKLVTKDGVIVNLNP